MNNRGSGARSFLVGAGVGAGLMALLDPVRGAARRSYIRDKVRRGIHIGQRESRKLLMEVRNEMSGRLAEQRARIHEGDIADVRLLARVRAQLGHVVRNFAPLEMSVRDGHVTVWGPVLHGEKARIEDRLRKTRGVKTFYVQVSQPDDLQTSTGTVDRVGPVEVQRLERTS